MTATTSYPREGTTRTPSRGLFDRRQPSLTFTGGEVPSEKRALPQAYFHVTIWPVYEAFYIDSMLFNTAAAGVSIDAVAEAIKAVEQGRITLTDVDQDSFLNHLQGIILHGAALSRFFWPVRSGHESRGKRLRAALGVTDASPLKNRELRNALEHFDERLDRYFKTNVVGHIFPRYVGRTPELDGVPVHLFRAYFVERGVFSLLGQDYEMQPLVDEIGRIHIMLIAAVQDGNRLPSDAEHKGDG